MKISDLKNKKILILGFGREGLDTFLFLRKLFPEKTIGIGDRSPDLKSQIINFKKVRFHLGQNYLKAAENYDLIIKSPGIPFKILPKDKLKKTITQTDIFFENCPGKIIGITGTKGKSTTTSLIYQILKKGGLNAHLIGNIGKPALNFLFSAKAKDIYVYELSSHQLYNLKKSPQVAVFLNIFPEHLDYYLNFKQYARAKANITLHQNKNDVLVYNAEDKIIKKFAEKSKAKKIPIKGEYYDLNKTAAKQTAKIFKISPKIIEKAIKEFKPLPHRLELVGTFKGITFYNDALSTIPETAIFAVKSFKGKVNTILLGGFDRKIDFKKLADEVLKNKIKTVILFPTTGEKIWKAIETASKNKNLPKHFFVNNMQEAVRLAYKHTEKEKICLLSCASTSFSIFKDYKEKGNLFKKYVKFFNKKR